jgi:diaminopimelate epimerase
MTFSFTKWQGCGNDFVIIDCQKEPIDDYAAMAKKICDRHFGVGADGLIVVLPSAKADFRMRIFNTDGSEAEMCGNGIRCFARYVFETCMTNKESFTIETGAGIMTPQMEFSAGGSVQGVKVDMGEPILAADKIPVDGYGSERVIAQPIAVLDKTYQMTCVSMGNPHCVIFVDDIDKVPIESVGPAFECHKKFPRKTNTEFVEVKDKGRLRMRVWERGAAVTLACGTGSCATLVAAVLNGKADKKAEIELDGGKLMVEWADDNHVYMTGPAEIVFEGRYDY